MCLHPPKTEESIESLPVVPNLLLCLHHFEPRLIIAGLLIRQFKIAHVSRIVQPLGKLNRSFARFGNRPQAIDSMLTSLRGLKVRLYFRGQLQDLRSDFGFSRSQLVGGNPFAQWDQDQLEKVLCDRIFNVRAGRWSIREADAGSKAGITQRTSLDPFALCDSDFLELALQIAIVEQRDLHRTFCRELLTQK